MIEFIKKLLKKMFYFDINDIILCEYYNITDEEIKELYSKVRDYKKIKEKN